MAHPSVIAPVGMALETMRRVLFQPFNLVKWLAIGFTAWLAMLEGGLGSGFNFNPAQCKPARAVKTPSARTATRTSWYQHRR